MDKITYEIEDGIDFYAELQKEMSDNTTEEVYDYK